MGTDVSNLIFFHEQSDSVLNEAFWTLIEEPDSFAMW